MTSVDSEAAVAVDFLRFLCAPASCKRTYLSGGRNRRYTVEMVAGYFEGSGSLRLLFAVGHEAITSRRFYAGIPGSALEYLNDLSVILTLIRECHESVSSAMAADISDGGGGFVANCWAQLSLSSARLLEALGQKKEDPEMAMDDLFEKCCRRI